MPGRLSWEMEKPMAQTINVQFVQLIHHQKKKLLFACYYSEQPFVLGLQIFQLDALQIIILICVQKAIANEAFLS